mmetsp:Transcript_11487/g.24242  ORF Transcript_11487/g.24242 Transcript_11487/m.24242 type:complete len:286 (+) Transcript_11487:297-1154(+)
MQCNKLLESNKLEFVKDHPKGPVTKPRVRCPGLRVEGQNQAHGTNLGGIAQDGPRHRLALPSGRKIGQRQDSGRELIFVAGRDIVAPGRIAGHQRVGGPQADLPQLSVSPQDHPHGGGIRWNPDPIRALLGGAHRAKASPVRADNPGKHQPAVFVVGGQFRCRFAPHDDVVDAEPGGGCGVSCSCCCCCCGCCTCIAIVTIVCGCCCWNEPGRALDPVCRAEGFGLAGLPIVANEIDSFGHGPAESGDTNGDSRDCYNSYHASSAASSASACSVAAAAAAAADCF